MSPVLDDPLHNPPRQVGDGAIQRGRLTMLTTPSTCIQLSKVSQSARMLPGPPAFRIVDVSGGELSTRVLHVRADAADAL